ncbi:MAG: ABC transporter permease [Methanocellales archaeon]
MKIEKTFIIFSAMGILMLMLVVLPIFNLIFAQSLSDIYDAIGDESVHSAIFLSIASAAIAAMIACISGVPLAFILARKKFKGKQLIEGIIDLPMAVPHTVAGIALLSIFGRRGLIGAALEPFGLRFYSTTAGIVIAMLFVSSPFLVNAAREGFESIDPRIEKAARTLGASQFEVFRRISLPLAARSILTGGVLAWARGISEFGAIAILAYHPMTAPVLIYERFLTSGFEQSSSIAVVLLVICLSIFAMLRYISQRSEIR